MFNLLNLTRKSSASAKAGTVNLKVEQSDIRAEAATIIDKRETIIGKIALESVFVEGGGKIYPYDTLGANLDPLFGLLDASGFHNELRNGQIRTVCDVGCANGELALTFAASGYQTTAIDFTYKHDRAPYVVKRFSEELGVHLSVADMSVDKPFTISDLKKALIGDVGTDIADDFKFDLVVCFGLLYHLKNPFAFMESLAILSRRVLLGTHLFTHLPELRMKLDGDPLAYLVDSRELNYDPTNFWIFTEAGFHRLVRRSGFEIVASMNSPNNDLGIAVPNRTDLGVRGFVALRSICDGNARSLTTAADGA